VRVGGRYETPKLAGASHFIEHLLFKGTTKRSAKAISQEIEGRGGYLNAYTQEESTCYFVRLPYEYNRQAFNVLADMYRNAKLAEADVERERTVILEEIKMYNDQPQSVVMDQLGSAVWSGHPIGLPLAGNVDSLSKMSRDDLETFRRTRYQPNQTIVAFAGRVDHDACVAMVAQELGEMVNGKRYSYKPVTPETPQEAIRLGRRDIAQVHAALGFRTNFSRHDSKRRVALRMLNSLLGENMSSRLFQVVRERYGMAYAISSIYQLLDDTGVVMIGAGLDSERAERGLQLVARELERIKSKPVGVAELKRSKDYLLGSFRLSLEATSRQLSWIGDSLACYGSVLDPKEFIEEVKKTTAAELQAVAEEVFDRDRLSLSLVVPNEHPLDESAWLKTMAEI